MAASVIVTLLVGITCCNYKPRQEAALRINEAALGINNVAFENPSLSCQKELCWSEKAVFPSLPTYLFLQLSNVWSERGGIRHSFKRMVIATTIANIDHNKFDVFSQ